jgi:hypothetical protein
MVYEGAPAAPPESDRGLSTVVLKGPDTCRLVRRPGGPISGHRSSNARWPHQAARELLDATRTPSTTAGGRSLVPAPSAKA